MKGPEVFRFSGKDEWNRLKNEKAERDGKVPVSLDRAKAISVRGIIEKMRGDGEVPYLWAPAKLEETREQVAAASLRTMIEEINGATEALVRERPTYYLALLESIDASEIARTDSEDR
jgi:hypothetical protein